MAGSTQPTPGRIPFPFPFPFPSDINIINGTNEDDKDTKALKGTALKDQINGLDGNDELTGFGGEDDLRGGNGNDSLDGGPDNRGRNTLRGGNGSDTYFVHSQDDVIFDSTENVQDFVISDAKSYKLSDTPVEQLFLRGFGDGGTIVGQGNKFNNFIAAQFGAEHATSVFEINGFGGNDEIQGDANVTNKIFGGAGNDTIFAGGRATDNFASGVDEIGSGSNMGVNEIDTIDVGFGDAGDTTVQLGDSRGAYYQGVNDFARIKNFLASGDRVILAGSKENYTTKVVANALKTDFNVILSFKSPVAGSPNTFQLKDVAIFEDITNRFVGHTLENAKSQANNILNFAQYIPINTPVQFGSASNNKLQGTNANGILSGKDGNDKLSGMGGADVLLGGKGKDTLDGGAGKDILDGGNGQTTDWLMGGTGEDTFVVAQGRGTDWITDFQSGDRLGYKGDVASANITFVAAKGGTYMQANHHKIAFLQGVNPNQVSLNDVVQIGTTQLHGVAVPTILG